MASREPGGWRKRWPFVVIAVVLVAMVVLVVLAVIAINTLTPE